jgi:octaprenyl-diphosphate synthase
MTLSDIVGPIRGELALVEEELGRQVDTICARPADRFSPFPREAVRHMLGAPGKRLRPILTLLSARAASLVENRDALIKVATVSELVHTASLVHDDIIDEASERRGVPTVNAAWGNRTAVLVGDLFYAQFFAVLKDLREIGSARQLDLFDLYCDVTREMCYAEILEDQLARRGAHVNFDTYLQVIESKTATLMSAACESAAILAGAPGPTREALAQFGKSLGIAYQLVDDLEDADASFDDRSVTATRAREYGEQARERALALPQGTAARALVGMSEYVLSKLAAARDGGGRETGEHAVKPLRAMRVRPSAAAEGR